MDKGIKIFKTFENVNTVYREVSEILTLIDESFLNVKINRKHLKGQKGKKCTWDSSIAMNVPGKWMHKFFIRYYLYDVPKSKINKAIGICIWLYGDVEYEILFERPYISCSVVEFDKGIEGDLGECFRQVGKLYEYTFEPHENNELIMVSSFVDRNDSTNKLFKSMKTYFVNLTSVDSNENIEKFIIDPCIALLNNDLSKVVKRGGFLKYK